MAKKPSATVRVSSEPRPTRPRVDSGDEFETHVRQMFQTKAARWFKDNLANMPDKEIIGSVVDNLTATFSSALETTVDSAVDLYLSTVSEEDVIECPHCEHEFEVPDDLEDDDDVVECPSCGKDVDLDEDEEEDEEDDGDKKDNKKRRR